MAVKFTERAEKVLAAAGEEARSRSHDLIGTGHVLHAIVSQKDSIAMQALHRAHTDVEGLQSRVDESLSRIEAEGAQAKIPLTPDANRGPRLASDEAVRPTTLLNRRELGYLATGVLFLAIANTANFALGKPFWDITQAIYLGFESNIPTWYSSILLAVAGLIAYECFVCARRRRIQGGFTLALFSGLLFFMSADEVSSLHETLGSYAFEQIGLSASGLGENSDWVWIGGPLVCAVFVGCMFLLRRVTSLVPQSTRVLALGFSLIVLGGVVLESTTNFLNHEELQWLWEIEVIIEESLEMMGTVVVAYALLLWRDGVAGSAGEAPSRAA